MAAIRIDGAEYHIVFQHQVAIEAAEIIVDATMAPGALLPITRAITTAALVHSMVTSVPTKLAPRSAVCLLWMTPERRSRNRRLSPKACGTRKDCRDYLKRISALLSELSMSWSSSVRRERRSDSTRGGAEVGTYASLWAMGPGRRTLVTNSTD